MIGEIGHTALIVIDPISAYMGGTDSHKNSDVRSLLHPLSKIASAHNVAVLCVTHLNKGGGRKALERVTGSGAFVAAARAAYVVAKDEEMPERRLILPIKNNLGDDRTGLAFAIESITLGAGIETSRIVFEDELVMKPADEILSPDKDNSEINAIDEAIEFLKEELGHYGLPARMIKERARQAGISERTLRRGKEKLGIKAVKEGSAWFWKPNINKEHVQEGQPENVDTLDTFNNVEVF